ncbi:beta-N-acetylhexosaminidase [Pseudobutyrivibrio sp. ACV-2]|uniref:glycoside hydrolase family 3 protein n=1 Tax=Pseudobutyrivibrio sp. ACV-2 TaxID=1520801 RepID=UPI00089C78AB|nr:glycoside hydrolase family 3 N-terminal domain-containing protein [Pseudobutyrivibrio sp. ACV-2]SEA98590.1 beta-N-acetylhexosaminidase [Pseudobutyrivibrio sp. ACV-2]
MKRGLALLTALVVGTTTLFSQSAITAQAKANTIEAMVQEMPVEQKVAQMFMPSFRYWGTGDDKKGVTELNDELRSTLKKYHFGGVILFGQNAQNAKQTTELVADMQKANLQGGATSSLLISIDQEGGYVSRLNTGTQMPGNMAIAATGNPDNAYKVAQIMGEELAVQGINLDFGPVMDVNNNPANPIIGVRSFSDKPEVVAKFGQRYIDGLHANGVMSALKHFPGHGDTATDSHTGLPLIDKSYDELKQFELIPYASVAKSTDFIMTAHIQYPQIEKGTYVSKKTGEVINLPATLSKTILTDILRKDLGFDGVIVTDAMDMDAIKEHFDRMDAAKYAINAGANLLLIPVDLTTVADLQSLDEYIAGIVKMIQSGEISEARVNDSVTRILNVKAKYGLLYDDSLNKISKWSRIQPSVNLAESVVGCKEHHDVEWKMALQAITSVKNDDAFPIATNKKVTVLYPAENQKLSITYAINKLNESGIKVDSNNVNAICVKDFANVDVNKALEGADEVICISATYSAEVKNKDFVNSVIKTAHANNAKVVLVSAHLPYDSALYPEADGIVACYSGKGMPELPTGMPNNKQYGANLPAAIFSIFGGSNPTGVMPVSF